MADFVIFCYGSQRDMADRHIAHVECLEKLKKSASTTPTTTIRVIRNCGEATCEIHDGVLGRTAQYVEPGEDRRKT